MKVLFVSNNAKLSNPFVETLIAGLYEFNLDCTASIKEWWANVVLLPTSIGSRQFLLHWNHAESSRPDH
jgi:hypothetical protein